MDVGFYPKAFVQFALPQQRKADWSRYFGPNRLIHRGEVPSGLGGRLALLYLTTELARPSRGQFLGEGRSLRDLRDWMGISRSGGRRSGIESVRRQLAIVLRMEAQILLKDGGNVVIKPQPSGRLVEHENRGFDLLQMPAELGGWTEDVVPVDMQVIRSLGKDTLALDLYLALTYRSHGLRRQFLLTYGALQGQLGADFSEVSARVFKWRVLKALRRIEKLYPALRVSVQKSGLMLLPSSRTSVPTRAERGSGFRREPMGVDDVAVKESRPPP